MNEPVYDLRGHYAGFVSRLMAFLIDRGIIWAIVAMAAAVTTYLFNLVGLPLQSCHYSPTFPGVVCLVVQLSLGVFALSFAPLYTILFWTLATQTPGKYVMGLRIYRMNGERLTFRRALRRYVGYLFSFLAFGLGFFWITIDDQRQGFHDIFADT
ncbi:MAG TPA: RDD family protein [Caldilineae bacterium]|nr:RDD family protein [Caldilineae bacterium]